jgi:hypothetical protein
MAPDRKIRPWRKIAQELQAEHDPRRIVELASELTAALDKQNSRASLHEQKQPSHSRPATGNY